MIFLPPCVLVWLGSGSGSTEVFCSTDTCDTAVFPFCRAVGTQLASFSFSHSGLFPLHCRDIGSKLCCRLTVQINKRRRVSRGSGWGKSIRSHEDGSQQECERAEVRARWRWGERQVISRAPNCMLKSLESFSPPRGNDCSGAQWGLVSDYDRVCIQCPACKTWEGGAVKSWFIMPLHPGYLIVRVGDVKSRYQKICLKCFQDFQVWHQIAAKIKSFSCNLK